MHGAMRIVASKVRVTSVNQKISLWAFNTLCG